MNAHIERWLRAVVPFVAMLTVALGLRLGAPSIVRAAVVYASPSAAAGTGLAWQVVALEDQRGVRSALAGVDLDVTARSGEASARWHGRTNEDGVAEAQLALPLPASAGVALEVRAGETLLAGGLSALGPTDGLRREASSAWMPFAQRSGTLVLDVATLGQRAAPGFAATVWVRATDPKEPSGSARVAGALIEPESDPSLIRAIARTRTDSTGWAELEVTPVGLAVALHLRASTPDGRSGDWTGGLFMSPGAAGIETRARWAPSEAPEIDVTLPGTERTAYVEIDDASGRAWATTMSAPMGSASGALPRAHVEGPSLAPGLYWAVASNGPAGASSLGPGTIVRPFFVAATDDAALAFGTDPIECGRPTDARQASTRIGPCLAVAAGAPVPRWIALDGFARARAADGDKRSRGLAVSVGAVLTAMLLEAVLVLRAAATSRARVRAALLEGATPGTSAVPNGFGVAIGLLVALLGFMLLAAFLVRTA